jgi:hypothetical protein
MGVVHVGCDPLDGARVGHVALVGLTLRPDLGAPRRRLLGRLAVEVDADDAAAGFRQRDRRRRADPAPGAGDEGGCAGQLDPGPPCHHAPTVSGTRSAGAAARTTS